MNNKTRIIKVLYRPCYSTHFSWKLKELAVTKCTTYNQEVVFSEEVSKRKKVGRKVVLDRNLMRPRKLKNSGLFSTNRDTITRGRCRSLDIKP